MCDGTSETRERMGKRDVGRAGDAPAMSPAKKGAVNQDTTMLSTPPLLNSHTIPLLPKALYPTPMMAPIVACVDETGISRAVAVITHTADPTTEQLMPSMRT
jgi:hypothetical protein